MIVSLLAELHERHGLTSVFVTHNLSFASRCDRVLEMKRGSLDQPSVMELQGIGIVQDATRPGGGTYV
jgi:lipoprotein-releasing system ATP-binding protein